MYRVMIVDDDAPFARSIEGFDWAGSGCRLVYTADNGRDALEKCALFMPHIVVTDINMPVMDGIELTRALREKYPEIRVILLTVHKEFAYAREAVSLGACDYLVKDMGYRAQLPEVLARAISGFEGRDALEAFLSRGGRLLFLAEDGRGAAPEELDTFFRAFGGTLITARLDACRIAHGALLKAIDGKMADGLGWVVRGADCVELCGQDDARVRGFWRALCADKAAPFSLMPAAFSKNVTSAGRYETAHRENLLTAEACFYDEETALTPARDQHFSSLPMTRAEAWAQQALSAAAEDTLDAFAAELKGELRRERYVPSEVRGALTQVLRALEQRWAERMDEGTQREVLAALTLSAALKALFARAKALRASGDTMSYQCRKAVDFMRERLNDPELSLAMAAESVFISPGYLSKRLKEETGSAFKELLIKLRMERAAELINQGRDKVYEIALKTGYLNYRSFAAAFEAYYGVSVKKFKGRAT